MPWCPKCKNEYREGMKVCADCGCELVAEEPVEVALPSKEDILNGNLTEEQRKMFLKKLAETSGMREEKFAEELSDIFAVEAMAGGDIETEALDEAFEDNAEAKMQKPENRVSAHAAVYKKSSEKAEDNKSSASTLLVVGGIGMVFMILGMTGLLPFKLGNSLMFYGVMSAVFIIFIIMGVVSMKNAKIFAGQAETENNLRETMKQWCQANLKAEEIDAKLALEESIDELPEEILYFKRYEKLKEMLNYQFMNLDQDLLDNFLDEVVYDMVYGE